MTLALTLTLTLTLTLALALTLALTLILNLNPINTQVTLTTQSQVTDESAKAALKEAEDHLARINTEFAQTEKHSKHILKEQKRHKRIQMQQRFNDSPKPANPYPQLQTLNS